MSAIEIHGTSLPIVEVEGVRMVTFSMIDRAHQRFDGTAGRAFREHRDRFTAGRHYVELTADEIRRQSLTDHFPPRTPKGILLTERGYLLLAKSLTDDLAWQVQEELVDGYFHQTEALASLSRGDRQVHGGIMRAVTNAVMREHAAAIVAQVAAVVREQLPALVTAEIATASHQLVQGISAIEVAEIAGFARGRRPRGLVQFISGRLALMHEQHRLPIHRSRRGHGGVKLYDEMTARRWIGGGGRVELEHYAARKNGQTSFPLRPLPHHLKEHRS